MEGTMQSGIAFDLHIANLATDGQIVQLARDAADDTLDKDPELALPENSILRSELLQQASKAVDWSKNKLIFHARKMLIKRHCQLHILT